MVGTEQLRERSERTPALALEIGDESAEERVFARSELERYAVDPHIV